MMEIDHARLARLVAHILAETCERYCALMEHIGPLLLDESLWDAQRTYVRREAFDIAALIATAGRGIDLAVVNSGPQLPPAHDARRVAPLLRMVGDSALLIAAAADRADLASLPLAPLDLVEAARARSEVQAWIAAHQGHELAPASE